MSETLPAINEDLRHEIFHTCGLYKGIQSWYWADGKFAFYQKDEPRIECDVDDWLEWSPRLVEARKKLEVKIES